MLPMSTISSSVMPAASRLTLTRPTGRDHTRIAVVIRATSIPMCSAVAQGAAPPAGSCLKTHTHDTTNNEVATMTPSRTSRRRGAFSRSPSNSRHT